MSEYDKQDQQGKAAFNERRSLSSSYYVGKRKPQIFQTKLRKHWSSLKEHLFLKA
jgi:hypothetical protein